MTVLVVAEAIVIALLVVLVAGLLRSHADILRRLHALDGGESGQAQATARSDLVMPRSPGSRRPAERISGPNPAGGTVAIPLTETRGLTALAFLSSTCTGCRPFWRSFRDDVEMPHEEMRLVIVTKGPEEESPTAIHELAGEATTIVMSSQAWDDFGVPASPFFVLVDARSGEVMGEGSGPSWRRVSRMLADAIGDDTAATRFARPDTTAGRVEHTDDVLHRHGITADDPSLWSDPIEDRQT